MPNQIIEINTTARVRRNKPWQYCGVCTHTPGTVEIAPSKRTRVRCELLGKRPHSQDWCERYREKRGLFDAPMSTQITTAWGK